MSVDKIKELEIRVENLEKNFAHCNSEIYKLKRPSKFNVGDYVIHVRNCGDKGTKGLIVNVEWVDNRWRYLFYDESKKESIIVTEYEITR